MALGQIHDMNIIAHTGAVRGGVVVAKDLDLRALTGSHLHDKGHEVVGDAARRFADKSARVCTDRIEIAQAADLPAGVALIKIAQHFLDDELSMAGGIGADRKSV